MSVEKIDAFVAAQIISGIVAAVHTPIPQAEQQGVQFVRIGNVDEKVDVLRRSHDFVRRQRQATNQGGLCFACRKYRQRLSDLVDHSRHLHIPPVFPAHVV